MSNEKLYLKATKEADGEGRDDALWAKSMSLAQGDDKKAKYKYIELRVKELESETAADATKEMENESAKEKEDKPKSSQANESVDYSSITYNELLTSEAFSEYFGKSLAGYTVSFRKIIEKSGVGDRKVSDADAEKLVINKISWSWLGFFFQHIWMCYHNLRYCWAIAGLFIALLIIEIAYPDTLYPGIYAAFSLYPAMFGKALLINSRARELAQTTTTKSKSWLNVVILIALVISLSIIDSMVNPFEADLELDMNDASSSWHDAIPAYSYDEFMMRCVEYAESKEPNGIFGSGIDRGIAAAFCQCTYEHVPISDVMTKGEYGQAKLHCMREREHDFLAFVSKYLSHLTE